jgi:tripartite-type tricarboxylate transporter receptor subunit TctC
MSPEPTRRLSKVEEIFMRAARILAVGVVAAAVTVAAVAPVQSQTYPSRTIQMIVAYAAGGTGDIVARSVADKLGGALGQSVVVENRAGASGAIGAHSVTSAAPDGYTLLVGQTAEVAINQHWLKGLNYDPDKDLVPIALAAVVPLALVVPTKAPYSTLPEFLAALKAKPKMTFASAGIGTPGHFAGELLKLRFDDNLTMFPTKGQGRR